MNPAEACILFGANLLLAVGAVLLGTLGNHAFYVLAVGWLVIAFGWLYRNRRPQRR